MRNWRRYIPFVRRLLDFLEGRRSRGNEPGRSTQVYGKRRRKF